MNNNPSTNSQIANPSLALKGLVVSLLINVALPLLFLYILTHYEHSSEIFALAVASCIPILDSIIEVLWHRRLDLVAIFFLLGSLTSILALVLGGPVQLLIIRESFFSGALGLICLLSLLLFPRPLMFYTGRQIMAGNDPVRVQHFNLSWQNPKLRKLHRTITIVWGVVLVAEFLFRVVIALSLPPTVAYGLGSAVFTIVLAATFFWTFAYARRTLSQQTAPAQQ